MKYTIILIIFVSFALIIRYVLFFKESSVKKSVLDTSYTFLNEPRIKFGKQFFFINGVEVEAPLSPEFHYGDVITIRGEISSKIQQFTNSTGKQKSREILLVKNPKISIVKNKKSQILALINDIRQHLRKTFYSILPGNYAGLLLGIVFGIKDDVSHDFFKKLQVTGVLHVVAASGMNVTLVAAFLFHSLRRFLRRQIALGLSLLGIVFYAVLSGLGASIIRASLMAVSVNLSGISGRQNFSYLSLFLACFLMLFVSPQTLFDVGFELSAGATFGILLLKPVLDRALSPKKFILFDDLHTTVAAQVMTLPILLGTFSTYSPISILVNFCVLWMVSYLMILGGIAALVSFIVPFLAIPFLYLSYPFLILFDLIISSFSSVAPQITIENLPLALVLGYYSLVLAFVLLLNKRLKISSHHL